MQHTCLLRICTFISQRHHIWQLQAVRTPHTLVRSRHLQGVRNSCFFSLPSSLPHYQVHAPQLIHHNHLHPFVARLGSGNVWVSKREAIRIAEHLHLGLSRFAELYTLDYTKIPGWWLLKNDPKSGEVSSKDVFHAPGMHLPLECSMACHIMPAVSPTINVVIRLICQVPCGRKLACV